MDVVFISESWERENLTLDKIINLEDHTVISNVNQRKGNGGRPAIIANSRKFHIQNLTNTLIQVPWGVEAVWCVLTPKNVKHDSRIQKIACCALYCKPSSNRKTLLLDHISDAYNILSTKYGRGLHFVLAGDTNDLKLDSILHLDTRFVQIVQEWTRMDPPAILDPIIMTLSNLYQEPKCLEPLDADPDKIGVKSDHRIVVARPINIIDNKCARQTRTVKFRPFPESGILKMRDWFMEQSWQGVYQTESAHDKAKVFQDILVKKLDEIFPEKIRKIQSDDQPWISQKLKKMDRKRKRIYRKERKSEKWSKMNKLFKKEVKSAKANFYKDQVADLKQKKPGQWYTCLKRISSFDQMKNDQVSVEELNHLISNNQNKLLFHPPQVWFVLSRVNTNKATVPGDFPARLIKQFAAYLAEPLSDIFNTSMKRGEYPRIYKFEICTPVPKSYPPQNTSQLRNISGLLNFDRVFVKIISQLIIADMESNMDPAQFGNQKGISVQHYLIQMLHRILTVLDNNSRGDIY